MNLSVREVCCRNFHLCLDGTCAASGSGVQRAVAGRPLPPWSASALDASGNPSGSPRLSGCWGRASLEGGPAVQGACHLAGRVLPCGPKSRRPLVPAHITLQHSTHTPILRTESPSLAHGRSAHCLQRPARSPLSEGEGIRLSVPPRVAYALCFRVRAIDHLPPLPPPPFGAATHRSIAHPHPFL